MKVVNIAGRKFGLWTIIGRAPNLPTCRETRWFAKCACGTEKIVWSKAVVRGKSTSCGCERTRLTKERAPHGMTYTHEHVCWWSMKSRCTRPRDTMYPKYGGKGIKICARWMDFRNFISDMGMAPSPRHSIDRIDNSGNYEPENCQWATFTQQARNRRSNRKIMFLGKERPLSEVLEMTGIPRHWIYRESLAERFWMRLKEIENGESSKKNSDIEIICS